ncbi:MAG: hypothetical protein LZF60_80271 [Nitrospira sp.]|nr:MAG: hypothetical protein LZF60_80271 [Nitrospira sp.]
MQSTPLISRSGRLVGLLSTQFDTPHRPTDDELKIIDMLAWTATEFINRDRTDQPRRTKSGGSRRKRSTRERD